MKRLPTGSNFEWIDGSALSWTNWHSGAQNDDCVKMQRTLGYGWVTSDCNDPVAALCQGSGSPPPAVTTAVSGTPQNGKHSPSQSAPGGVRTSYCPALLLCIIWSCY